MAPRALADHCDQVADRLAQADLLISILITTLRRIGMFSSAILAKQRETHFPGSYLPYIFTVKEKRSLLVAGIYKADTYLSLRQKRPPLLCPEELDVTLPATLGATDAHPIPTFLARQTEEPSDRKERTILEVCCGFAKPSTLLCEDVTLRLCGLWPRIWRFAQTAPRLAPDESGKELFGLADRLSECQTQLDRMMALINAPNTSMPEFEEARMFMKSYRGLEDENSQLGTEAATRRAQAVLDEARGLLKDLRSALWAVWREHPFGAQISIQKQHIAGSGGS
jgi:hypothetical protein